MDRRALKPILAAGLRTRFTLDRPDHPKASGSGWTPGLSVLFRSFNPAAGEVVEIENSSLVTSRAILRPAHAGLTMLVLQAPGGPGGRRIPIHKLAEFGIGQLNCQASELPKRPTDRV